MIAEKILEYLGSKDRQIDIGVLEDVAKDVSSRFTYQFMKERDERKFRLRVSNMGKCMAMSAFGFHGFPEDGKSDDPKMYLTFFVGDIVEASLVSIAKLAGVPLQDIGGEQATVHVDLGGDLILTGHPDGLIEHDGKKYVLEVKSMSDYGFSKFAEGEDLRTDPFTDTYYSQMQAYVHAKEVQADGAVLLAFAKGTNEVTERLFPKDTEWLDRDSKRSHRVLSSSNELKEIQALREKGPNMGGRSKGRLIACSFCKYWGHCWNRSNVVERIDKSFGKEKTNLYLTKDAMVKFVEGNL